MAPLSSSSSSSSPNPRLIPWSCELCAVNTFSRPSISSEPTAKLAISSDPNRVLTSGSVAAATSKIWTDLKTIVVAKTVDSSGRGLVIYQKPTSESCYNNLFVLKRNYAPLRQCISKLPSGGVQKWPELWHKQLVSVKPQSVSADTKTSKKDTEKCLRNVMDMNAGFGG
ncbi:hypothetical protein Bca4012_075612 [Brassica carinata]